MPKIQRIIVIPARLASTRFPGKMLVKINGKSLIQHTYENASKSKKIKDLLIATDDKEILKEITSFGAIGVLTSKKCPNGTSRVYAALKKLDITTKNAIVINIQGDEPVLNPGSIDKLCSALEKDPSIKMATLVTPLLESNYNNPSVVKCVFDKNFNALYFSRSLIPYPRHEGTYYQHIGVYAFRYSFLETYFKLSETALQKAEDLEQLKVLEHGHKIKVIIDKKPSIGIDTPEDIEKLKHYLCQ